MKISDAIKEFTQYVLVTKSLGTIDFYRSYCKKIDDYFGTYECDAITNSIILQFILSERMNNPLISNATINKSIQTLKTVVKYNTGVTIQFKKLIERKQVIQVISQSTIKKIFHYYENNIVQKSELRNYLYILLLHDTGLRLNEINHIFIKNIDMEFNTIYVTITKTDLDRYVFFTDYTKNVMKKYLAVFNPDKLLLYNVRSKNAMSTTSVETMISRLKLKLNISENITPHKWRHTFATRFIRNGGDLETLRVLLGHTSLKTTQKYMHLNKQDLMENYNKIMKG